MYDAFLRVMSQLSSKRKARIEIDDNAIFFETLKNENCMRISTTIYRGEGFISPSVRSCVPSNGILHLQSSGAYLQLDLEAHAVHLIEEVDMEKGKYIPFKHHFSDFCQIAAEWREILQDFAERDYSFI